MSKKHPQATPLIEAEFAASVLSRQTSQHLRRRILRRIDDLAARLRDLDGPDGASNRDSEAPHGRA